MNKLFQTVDEYIESFEYSLQPNLKEIRKTILSAVPDTTLEIISYGMPSYKWNNSLIHFAQAKNHIGIYPGPGAIVALKEDISPLKTTKGSIHIPNNSSIPKKLIQDLVFFNVKRIKEKLRS